MVAPEEASQRLQRDGLTAEESAFLLANSGFSAEELTESFARVDSGELAEKTAATERAARDATLSADEVMAKLRVGPAALKRLTIYSHLHAIQEGSELRYPNWQFRDDPAKPLMPGISKLATAFLKGKRSLAFVVGFMRTPQSNLVLDDEPAKPTEWLLRGGDPEAIVEILEAETWR